jgi:transcriptional regulator with XRE-family HTH domain
MNGRALVAWNLRRIRVKRGLSQERLAFDSSVDRSYVGGLERREENRRHPRPTRQDAICANFGIFCRAGEGFARSQTVEKRSAFGAMKQPFADRGGCVLDAAEPPSQRADRSIRGPREPSTNSPSCPTT